MDAPDAHAIVSLLDAEWPKGAWLDDDGELTVRGELFRQELLSFDAEAGVEAVTRLRRRGVWSNEGPHTSDLLAALREVVHERELAGTVERLALPDPTVAEPEEAAAILSRYFDRVGRPVELEVRHAAQRGDPEAKVEAGRQLARQRIREAEERAALPPAELPPTDPTKALTACGVRWGTRMVRKGGAWVCPNCGRTAEEGCA